MIRPARALILVLLVIAGAACGSDDDSAEESGEAKDPSAGAEVVISGFAFDPESLTVPAGSTLSVVNDDDSAHTLTAEDESFDSGEIAGGETGSVEVSGSGEVPYYCEIHDYMKGVIVIE